MTRHIDVRPRSFARALALSSCFALVGLVSGLAMAGPPPPVDVNACVAYDEAEVDESTTKITLGSDCEASLRCEVSWSVTCEPGAPARKDAKAFTLKSGTERSVRVSTKHCGDKLWELNDLTWSCVQR